MLKRTLTTLGTAAVLLIGAADQASAESATGGTARTSEGPNINGAGTETSNADVDAASGRLSASAAAAGAGGLLGGLPLPGGLLPGTGASTAAARAGVERTFDVGPGTYEVTITLAGAGATISTSGRGSADGYVQSSASFPGSNHPQIAIDDLGGTQTVTRSFVIEIPEGEGSLFVSTDAVVIASANGRGNAGTATANVSQTTFTVARLD